MGLESTTRNIKLACPDAKFQLTINANAFRSSQSTALDLSVEKCDLRQLDWTFLADFYNLQSLHLTGSSLMNMQMNMPLLSSISALHLRQCGDFESLYPPQQTLNLIRLEIDNSFNVSDKVFDLIVSSAAAVGRLEILSLIGNQMTRIPSAVGNFSRLRSLFMDDNRIEFLPSGSLHVSSTALSSVHLTNNSLHTIQPGAFKGFIIRII